MLANPCGGQPLLQPPAAPASSPAAGAGAPPCCSCARLRSCCQGKPAALGHSTCTMQMEGLAFLHCWPAKTVAPALHILIAGVVLYKQRDCQRCLL